jgi:hypothetical protein
MSFLNGNRVIGLMLLGLVIGIAIGYSISIVAPYQSTTSKPSISLSSHSVKAGELYTATLTGFPTNTIIYGWTVNQNFSICFAAGTTDANGKLVLSANAPQTTGRLLLVACNKDETIWVASYLDVI